MANAEMIKSVIDAARRNVAYSTADSRMHDSWRTLIGDSTYIKRKNWNAASVERYVHDWDKFLCDLHNHAEAVRASMKLDHFLLLESVNSLYAAYVARALGRNSLRAVESRLTVALAELASARVATEAVKLRLTIAESSMAAVMAYRRSVAAPASAASTGSAGSTASAASTALATSAVLAYRRSVAASAASAT